MSRPAAETLIETNAEVSSSSCGQLSVESTSSGQKTSATEHRLELACYLSLIVLWAAWFHKSVFFGKSLSRIALLPEWDSVFHAFRQGNSSLYDPSLVQLFAPQYFLVAKIFQQGNLPLWNPYCGFGAPLIGDIQASVFSPLRVFFNLNACIQMWNWMLLGETALCLLSTFALARYLKLGRIVSLFSAISYTFCPFNLWYLELNLGTASCIFPLVFLAFARVAKVQTVGSAVLSGASSAFLILSGHPESAFFGITFASLLMFCLLWLGGTPNQGLVSRIVNFWKLLLVAGVSTLAFTAPVLFPFVEYLLNSETYKYVSVCSAHVPWPGIVQHLFNPSLGGASPYLGIIAAVALPMSVLALFRKDAPYRRAAGALAVSVVVAFLLTSQLGIIESFFTKPPLTTIITRYCLPVFLLLCSLLSGIGLAETFSSQSSTATGSRRVRTLVMLAISSILVLLVPRLLQHNQEWFRLCAFDSMLSVPAFNSIAWKRDLICVVVVFALMLAAALCGRRVALRMTLCAAVLIPSLVSISYVGRLSLPLQPSFNYPMVEPLQKLQDPSWRCVSTCEHVFRPGSNAIYGIQDIQAHNPLFPPRYLSLIKECGSKVDLFNQNFGTSLSPLLNLTSCRYILSQLPVSSARFCPPAEADLVPPGTSIRFSNSLVLEKAGFWHAGTAGGGTVRWTNVDTTSGLTFAPVLFDSRGGALWFGEQRAVVPDAARAPEGNGEQGQAFEQKFSVPIPPLQVDNRSELSLGIQVFDRNACRFLVPADRSARERQLSAIVLGTFIASPSKSPENEPVLLQETPGHVRLYDNRSALPRSYVVYQSNLVVSKEQALKTLISPVFHPHREVIIETQPDAVTGNGARSGADDLYLLASSQVAQASGKAEAKAEPVQLRAGGDQVESDDNWESSIKTELATGPALPDDTTESEKLSEGFSPATLKQRGPNEVSIDAMANAPGYLVLTDVFYPGWKAYLDGEETSIFRANYAFRAVRIPQGNHTVVFKYEPRSFFLGVCCFALFVLGLCAMGFRSLMLKRPKR